MIADAFSSAPPAVWLVVVLAACSAFVIGRWTGRRARIRQALEGRRRELSGRLAEHWAPYQAGFPGRPEDARFLGAPIDFVVFDGLADDALARIVLVEVKSGKGKLTRRERAVRDCVRDGRVEWAEVHVAPSG